MEHFTVANFPPQHIHAVGPWRSHGSIRDVASVAERCFLLTPSPIDMTADEQQTPVLSPPIVILICILGALVLVVLGAVIYRLCRRSSESVTSDDGETVTFNPNKRSAEQTQRMEEVRWINNMYVWDRAREQENHEREWLHKCRTANGHYAVHEQRDMLGDYHDRLQSRYNVRYTSLILRDWSY